MLQLHNTTPFRVSISAMPDEEGIDALFVVVKGTFELQSPTTPADEQREIANTDRHRDSNAMSSLLEASEHHLGKPGTDVTLQGHAYAPGGKPIDRNAVSLQIADRRKVVAVFGDRQFERGGRLSHPRPFTKIPLTYERAFGGTPTGRSDAVLRASSCNPVGMGLAVHPGAPVPNLEDPATLLDGPRLDARPACFAPIAPGWAPRRGHAGTYDQQWIRRRAPRLPEDFDRRFFTVAPAELAFDRFFEGGEPIEIIGASPHGVVRFALPRCTLAVSAVVTRRREQLPSRLETVALWPDDEVFTMTWRAKLSCDRRLLRVESVRVRLDTLAEAS